MSCEIMFAIGALFGMFIVIGIFLFAIVFKRRVIDGLSWNEAIFGG